MPTFILKKYSQKEEKNDNEEQKKTQEENNDLTIVTTGSISEIVAKALNKVFANKLEIEEVDDEDANSDIKVVSTENINSDPVDTFRMINKDDVIFIHNRGFRTAKEEWFLTNLENKTNNVIYTLESFLRVVQSKLNLD